MQEAIADGRLEERRWHNYLKLQRELAALARRSDAAAQRAYQRGVAPEGGDGGEVPALGRAGDGGAEGPCEPRAALMVCCGC